MKRKAILVGVIVILLGIGWRYHKCLFQDDEKRIREIVMEMAAAAEAKNSAGLLDHFSKDYSDENGYNKFIIAQLITRALDSVDELRANVKDIDVLVTGERAWATVTVVTEAVKDGQISFPFGSDDAPETPRLTFKKTSKGDWVIIKVENVSSDF